MCLWLYFLQQQEFLIALSLEKKKTKKKRSVILIPTNRGHCGTAQIGAATSNLTTLFHSSLIKPIAVLSSKSTPPPSPTKKKERNNPSSSVLSSFLLAWRSNGYGGVRALTYSLPLCDRGIGLMCGLMLFILTGLLVSNKYGRKLGGGCWRRAPEWSSESCRVRRIPEQF